MFGAHFHVRDITLTPPALSLGSIFATFSFTATADSISGSSDAGERATQQRSMLSVPDYAVFRQSGEP